ncbi:MAG TPA: SH3 domain-containing protein [Thermomicrobiales bacterium]|nr:SH3 domain-containing protein [Thermomicrobiales bacterium]
MGNYWECADFVSGGTEITAEPAQPSTHGELVTVHQLRPLTAPNMDRRVYPVSGSSGYRDDPPIDDPGDDRLPTPGGSGRQIEYYSEERYWTDYLRIILPILGVLLFLVLLYLWALAFLRGDDETPGQGGVVATSTIPLITAQATATAAAGVTGTPGEPSIVLTPPPISTNPPETGSTPNPTAITPENPLDIYIGAIVTIANTGGLGANLRSEPTTESEVITVLLDGEVLEVIDGPQESQDFTWWNVTNESGTGWVVADYLEVIE